MKRVKMGKLSTILMGMAFAAVFFLAVPTKSFAYTQGTGVISADAAKVRKEPSTESDVVVGLLKGSTVIVTDEVTDSAGYIWYKVSVDSSSGYIRSDLMVKAASSTGNGSIQTEQKKPEANIAETKNTEPTVAKPIAETNAYINYESARIRQGASTNHELVGSAPKNTSVTITGEAKDGSGKLWYQIKYATAGGREVVGFIRSDLLTIGEAPAPETPEETPEEETPAEEGTEGETVEGETLEGEGEGETEPEEPEVPEVPVEETKPDYEMVYTDNGEGASEWYLYDNINGTRQKLEGLFAAAEAGALQSESDTKLLSTQKIIIIVLAAVAAILAIVVTILLFKIKDLYDDDYEEEDDDEEEEEDDEEDDEEEEVPVKRKRSSQRIRPEEEMRQRVSKPASGTVRTKERRVEYEPEQEEEYRGNIQPEPKAQPKRKAKNFMIDDDEFEFEFLNMEDKE